jgi:hypothetical protein
MIFSENCTGIASMRRETAVRPNDGRIIFKIPGSIPITLLFLIVLISALSLAVFALRMTFQDHRIASAIFLELCCIGAIWMLSVALLTISPVVATSSGITKCLLRIPVCTIRWEDVTAVHKLRQRQLYGAFFGSRGYADGYTVRRQGWSLIDALLPNLIHSIGFNDQFINLTALLNIVNERSKRDMGFRCC